VLFRSPQNPKTPRERVSVRELTYSMKMAQSDSF